MIYHIATREIEWCDATRLRVIHILRNPAYAGIYVYGRTAVDRSRPPSEGRPHRAIRPLSEQIWKENNHEPYIEPRLHSEILRRLDGNKHPHTIAPGTGAALLQGLLRCTIHQTHLETLYDRRTRDGAVVKRIPAYRCSAITHGFGVRCSQALARVIDSHVEAELLKTDLVLELEDLQTAEQRETRDFQRLVREREDERRRSQQRIDDLESERDQTSLEHHPRYREKLRVQIEEAMLDHAELELRHSRNPLVPPLTFDETQVARAKHLVADFPTLWRLPNVTPEQRKRVIRIVIDHILVTPRPEAWALEVCWVGGKSTFHTIPTHQGVRDAVRTAYADGRTEAEISALLNERGFVRRAGALAGTPFDEFAVRRLVWTLSLQPPFDEAAGALIAARCAEGVRIAAIAEELNAKGIRHRLGKWTVVRVNSAIMRLRRRGIIPPSAAPLDDRILALHHKGLLPREIVAQLRREGATTRGGRLVTRDVVYAALKRHGCQPHSLSAVERSRRLFESWVGTCTTHEMASRLNFLGIRTFRGQQWTEKIVRLRLEQLGLTKYARDLLDALLEQWAGRFTLPDLALRLNSLNIRTPRGHLWNEKYLWRHLALLGLGYRRRRFKPTREPKPTTHGARPQASQLTQEGGRGTGQNGKPSRPLNAAGQAVDRVEYVQEASAARHARVQQTRPDESEARFSRSLSLRETAGASPARSERAVADPGGQLSLFGVPKTGFAGVKGKLVERRSTRRVHTGDPDAGNARNRTERSG